MDSEAFGYPQDAGVLAQPLQAVARQVLANEQIDRLNRAVRAPSSTQRQQPSPSTTQCTYYRDRP